MPAKDDGEGSVALSFRRYLAPLLQRLEVILQIVSSTTCMLRDAHVMELSKRLSLASQSSVPY